jgi:hypothetical protein
VEVKCRVFTERACTRLRKIVGKRLLNKQHLSRISKHRLMA